MAPRVFPDAADDGVSSINGERTKLALEKYGVVDVTPEGPPAGAGGSPQPQRISVAGDGGKAAAFQAFGRERAELRDAKQMWFTVRGLGLIAVGALPINAGFILDFVAPWWPEGPGRVTVGALAGVGCAMIMAGLMLLTFADHDLDEVFSRRPGLGRLLRCE